MEDRRGRTDRGGPDASACWSSAGWRPSIFAFPSALFLLLLAVTAGPALAQRPAPERPLPDTTDLGEPEAVLEPLVDDEISGDPTAVLELLNDLRESPLNVNAATAAELAQVPALGPLLAQRIVERREEALFQSLPELRTVDGVSAEVFLEARPYLTIGEPFAPPARPARFPTVPTWAEVRAGARVEVLQRLGRRLDLGRGYDAVPAPADGTPEDGDTLFVPPPRYAGSPDRIYTRLRATYRRQISLNLTLEKDPGEPFEWRPEEGFYGYDYVSFHAAALDLGRIDAFVLGDFVAEFGQGLALWRASGFGKGRQAVRPLVRRGRGIRPYGSTDENRFFRGAAATVAVTPRLFATGFVSRRDLDATLLEVDTTLVEAPVTDAIVAGLAEDGLHRTPTELAKKDALEETAYGGALELRLDRVVLGAVGYRGRFAQPLARGDRPYQRFGFAGDEAAAASVYGSGFLGAFGDGDLQLFGEVAVAVGADGASVGALGGVEARIEEFEAIVLARHYPRDFASLRGYAFGERNGVTQNETGLYTGLRFRPGRTWTVSGFFDQYRFPWVRFAVPRPATGYEALLYVEHQPRRWLTLYAQGRTETRETGTDVRDPLGAVLDAVVPETRQSLRVQGEYLASRTLRLRARVEGSRYREGEGDDETGVLVYQDVRWEPLRWLRLDGRLTLFDTGGYGARLYQFENDLTGVLQNTLLYGRGTRAYVLVAVRPGGRFEGVDLRLKLAQTRFEDRRTVGSGLNEVEGDRLRDVAFQVRYRLPR